MLPNRKAGRAGTGITAVGRRMAGIRVVPLLAGQRLVQSWGKWEIRTNSSVANVPPGLFTLNGSVNLSSPQVVIGCWYPSLRSLGMGIRLKQTLTSGKG